VQPDDGLRRAELVGSLASVRTRISDACAASGRDPREVTLVAVTKTCPADDVTTLLELGVLDIGESRDQEASAKFAAVALAAPDIAPQGRWHFVGRLQTRKARSVAGYAAVVHSVDRPELVDRLAAEARRLDRAPIGVFVQLSLDGDPSRGGVVGDAVDPLADSVAAAGELDLLGLMAVAPLGADPDTSFAALAEMSSRIRAAHPGAVAISAGMSADLESAIRHGSTHVRIGSALLGRRGPVFG
jgi:pyridoxal phosphate enzyme (YggS family)